MPNSNHPVTRWPLFVQALQALDRSLKVLEKGAVFVAGASLFAMMIVIFIDATLRYSINRPLTITTDVVNLYLINLALLLVLGSTLRRGGHIGVEQFALIMPKRIYHSLSGVALLCCAIVVGLMATEGVVLSWDSWMQNELMIGIWPWPIWASKMIVAFSIVILEFRLLHIGLTHLVAGILDEPAVAITIVVESSEEGV